MPSATPILYRKRVFGDGAILGMKLWQVPGSVRGSAHEFKYSLLYGRGGEQLIGYDNEARKGDLRHYRDREELYRFTTPKQLAADFLTDVRSMRSD